MSRIHQLTAEIRTIAQRGPDPVTMTHPRALIEQRLDAIEAEAETLVTRTAAAFDVEPDTLERLGWVYEGNREPTGWRAPSGRFFELAESQLDVIGPHALECAAAQLVALTAKGGR